MAAGTVSRVFVLWMPRDRGKLQDQLVEVVDVLPVGEVKLVPHERVHQQFDCMEVGAL